MALGSVSLQGSPAKPGGRGVGRERGAGLDLGATWAEAHRPPLGASSLTPVEFLMSQGWYFPSSEGSRGTPLVAQCLRLCTANMPGSSLISGQETRSCMLQ